MGRLGLVNEILEESLLLSKEWTGEEQCWMLED